MYTGLNTPDDYLRVIRNHKWMIIIPIIVCLLIAGALCFWLPKSYRSQTLIYFEGQKVMYVKGVDDQAPEGGANDPARGTRLNTVKEMLYKRELLTQLADEFHLYNYSKENGSPERDDKVASILRNLVKVEPKDPPLLAVSFADEDPNLARAVTARLAEIFVQENMKARSAIAHASAEFLQHELDAMKLQLEAKERALAQFKQAHLGQLPEQMDSNLRAIDRLETEATAQRELEKTLNLRRESVEKAIREYEDPTSEESIKRAEKDPRLAKIKELRRQLAGLQSIYKETYPDVARIKQELKQLQAMTTEEYIALYIDQEPDGSGEVKSRRRKVVDPYKAELLKQRDDILRELDLVHMRQARIAGDIKKYEARIEATALHQKELMSIERDYENLQKNYQSLLEKKLHAEMAGDLEQKRHGAQMHIVEPATLPGWPEKPNLLLVMFGGLAAGCALGFGSAFGIEILRRGFVSAEEIEVTLGLPVIATISNFEVAWPNPEKPAGTELRRSDRLLSLPAFGKESSPPSRESEVSVMPQVVAMWYPRSVVAEQYRVAATRVGLLAGRQASTVLVVSSAVMGEGKTSTALNMAHVFARDLNKKTVLIDCDLKRPMVHAYAGIPTRAGLGEVLAGKKVLEECLEYHEQLGIWILSAGSELTVTAALTHADRLAEVVQTLRSRFEYVVLDSPPLLPVAESMLIVRMADVVAHVVRARSTRRDSVTNALKMIGDERPLGIILNALEAKDTPYSYYNYYHVAYESHPKQLR